MTSDIKMNFESLRLKHKEFIVERAFNIYKPSCESGKGKEWWVEFLLSGNDIHEMIRSLKENSETPVSKNIKEIERPSASSVGQVKIIDDNLELHAGLKRKLWVELENFSDTVFQTTPEEPVFIAYHWYQEDGAVYEFDGVRTPIPQPLGSGGKIETPINLTPPAEPGNYELMVTIVHEGRCWMEDAGLAVSTLPLEVQDYDGRGLTRHALSVFKQLHAAEMEVMH